MHYDLWGEPKGGNPADNSLNGLLILNGLQGYAIGRTGGQSESVQWGTAWGAPPELAHLES